MKKIKLLKLVCTFIRMSTTPFIIIRGVAVQSFLKKLKIELIHDSAILHLDMHINKMKAS